MSGSCLATGQPYATSHNTYDKDEDFQEEVREAALTLRDAVMAQYSGKQVAAGSQLEMPRQK